MDLADIPAAAAFLGAELQSASAAESARGAASAGTAASRPRDHSDHSGAKAMEQHANATAAALLDAAAQQFYPTAAAAAASTNMAQHYYAQSLASFPFMPMYNFNMFGGGAAPFLAPPPQSGSFIAPPPQPLYDMDATALQNQFAAQFTQATPEQKPAYYEDIRQQLHAAASGLDENQKQALLHNDPSLSFSMKPLDQLDSNANFDDSAQPSSMMETPPSRGSTKRVRTESNAAGVASGAAKKKPRKNKASSSCEDPGTDVLDCGSEGGPLKEESSDASSAVTTPRAPRGRPPGSGKMSAAAAAAAAGIQLTASGKKKSMTPQAEEMRARKAKMTWPKGTFIIRLQDVKVRTGRDHIWLVDNHQLLQRYNNESGGIRADGSRVYHKTDRYTGWLCNEGFHYFPLFEEKHVLRQDADTVTVLFPNEEELQQAIDYQEQEKERRAKEAGEPVSRPLPPSIRNEPARLAQQLQLQQEQQHHQQQLKLESAAHSSASGTSMMSSAAPLPMTMRSSHGYGHHDSQQMMGGMMNTVCSVSPSSSMMAVPSTSRRGPMRHEMPSLTRQSYWAEEEEALGEDILDEREFKQEEIDEHSYIGMPYSGMK